MIMEAKNCMWPGHGACLNHEMTKWRNGGMAFKVGVYLN